MLLNFIRDLRAMPLPSPNASNLLSVIKHRPGRYSFHNSCFKILDKEDSQQKILHHHNSTNPNARVTFFSVIFKSSIFIAEMLDNFTKSLLLSDSRLILIQPPNDPEEMNNMKIILPYLRAYNNISYVKLNYDPKLYDCWNLGIFLADTEFVGNMNPDDMRHPLHSLCLTNLMIKDPTVDIACTGVLPIIDKDRQLINQLFCETNFSFSNSSSDNYWYKDLKQEIAFLDLFEWRNAKAFTSRCIPHCAPIWRRSLHQKYGLFDEAQWSSAADWLFWLKCSFNSSKIRYLDNPYVFYYFNPDSYMRVDSQANHVLEKVCEFASHFYIDSSFVEGTQPSDLSNYLQNLDESLSPHAKRLKSYIHSTINL